MEAGQYEFFIASLKKEQQYLHRIKDLVQYRKNGVLKKEGQCVIRCVSVCDSSPSSTSSYSL